jgi:hypothetical protein
MSEQIAYVENTAPGVAPAGVRRVSWGAIFAGVFLAIILQIMLTLLGVAIGITSFQSSLQPAIREIATASGIWLVVTALISTWVGAWVAGRLAGGPRRSDGLIHGIVTWSLATTVTIFLLATAVGAALGGMSSLLGNVISSTSSSQGGQNAAANTAQGLSPQAEALLPPTGRSENPQVPGKLTQLAAQDPELAAAITRMESKGGASRSPADRDLVIRLLTTKHQFNQQDAENLVNQWDQQFQKVRSSTGQKAEQAGNAAATDVSKTALWGFITLALGLIFAAWGGWAGTASLPRTVEAVTIVK